MDQPPPTEPTPENRPSPVNGQPPPASHTWRPGQSGNPKGRPKSVSVMASVREFLQRTEYTIPPDKEGEPATLVKLPPGVTVADLLAQIVIRQALRGNYNFIRELLDRIDGRVPAKIESKGFTLADVVAEAEAAAKAHKPAERPGRTDQ